MRFPIALLTVCYCLTFAAVAAQTGTAALSGTVYQAESIPAAFATVMLYPAGDSTFEKAEYSDETGAFQMLNLPPGDYRLQVSYVGMATWESPGFHLAEGQAIDWPPILLSANSETLSEVVVKGQRAVLELKDDGVVFNVEKSINAAGANAFELLQKSPGVLIDQSGRISMRGRSGVAVAINGKPSPLRGEDLVNYLRTLQGNQIEAIEIIHQPGARYEAEGNAGIINIRLKKSDSKGTNLGAAWGYSIGQQPRYFGSLDANHRSKAVNVFGSYSYTYNQIPYTEAFGIRAGELFFDKQTDGHTDLQKIHSFKTGIDVALSPNSVVGFLAVGALSHWDWQIATQTGIREPNGLSFDSILLAQSQTLMDRRDLAYNLNYRFENDEGTLLNLDADYARYDNRRENTQPNEFVDRDNQLLSSQTYFTNSPTDIHIATFRADHQRSLGKGKLGAGLKLSYVHADNTFDFFSVIDGQLIPDIDRTNQFFYRENVNSGYLSFDSPLGEKISLSAGLRGEHTHSTGTLTDLKDEEDQKVERNYFDLFPSLRVSYTPGELHHFELAYNRRINRPPYQELNPFLLKLDELFNGQGNPFLQPEYASNVQLQHTLAGRLTSTLGFRHVKDLMARVLVQDEGGSNLFRAINLQDQYLYSLNIGAPFSPFEWWSVYGDLTAFHLCNKGELEGIRIEKQATSLNFSVQSAFQLPGGLNLEILGFYNSPTLWGANQEVGTIWSVDMGIGKKLFKGNGRILLSVSDLFWTNVENIFSDFGTVAMDYFYRSDSRRVNLNFSYRFGNTALKASRERDRGLEDETNRAN